MKIKMARLPEKSLIAGLLMACCTSASAQQAAPQESGEPTQLGEIVVKGSAMSAPSVGASYVSPETLDTLRPSTSDTASLLRDVPGVSLQGAGGVSSLPVIHGLADDRVRTQVDGVNLMSACPNHMNPPLSYIDPTNVKDIKVYAGITPVSAGGDSIGGTIQVESARPTFAKQGAAPLTKGDVGTFYRGNGNARGANVNVTFATDKLSLGYSGAHAQADDYTAGGDFKAAGLAATDRGWLAGDQVGSTAYKSTNQALSVALRSGDQLFDLKLTQQRIPYESFPNQRMDMTKNDNTLVNFHYVGGYGWGTLEARLYRQKTEHEMQFGDDKQYIYGSASGMPMDAQGKTTGAQIKADIDMARHGTLRVGGEYLGYRLNDWWPPSGGNMAPGTFQNINDGHRDRFALFGEWELHFNSQWMSLLGVRHETVKTDTGDVHGYCTSGMCMGNQIGDSNTFDSQTHGRTDQNWDLTALARYVPDTTHTYEFGIARKTHSPNLYERYAWSTWSMAAVMNNFLGDGNGYVGNLDLRPEVANTLSATADWHDADKTQWGLKVTPYYTYVHDYIDAQCQPGTTCAANQFNVLQYVNHPAELYGIDLSGHVLLARTRNYGSFTATGLLSYVRGKNRATNDNLYNIMPLNAKLAVVQRLGRWTNTIEALFVAEKNQVSQVRNEIETGGYSLFNLRSSYEWKQVRLDVGIENLFDKSYSLPLGGAYVGQGKTMSINGVPWGVAVPGMGRSIYTSLNFKF